VYVGDSSRNLPLTEEFHVDRTTGPRYTKVSAPAIAAGGGTLSVTTTFTNGATEDVRKATTSLSVPAGWTATPTTPAAFRKVQPGTSVSTTWSVTVPAGAPGGAATLTGATRYEGSPSTSPGDGSTTIQVAYANLAAAFNTVGVTDDANPAPGNLDGAGFSLSALALASVGVVPGGTVSVGSGTSSSASFTWPAAPAGQPDTVTTAGQSIMLTGSGSALSVLGAGTNGAQSGPVTITYTDGSTSTATLTFADWYNNQAVPGCTLVATAPYWNRPAGSTYPHDQKVSLYAASIPLSAGKQAAYMTVPNNKQLHIFADTVS
jgi:beta-glucosidase